MSFLQAIFGIVIGLTVAAILYIFRVRQLYLFIPRMFSYGGLTGTGKIVELMILNKGNSTEEDVVVNLPPGLKNELIASDCADVQVDGNRIILRRITPKTDISIILLIEGIVDGQNLAPTISSKTTKGKIYSKETDIPYNFGTISLVVIGVIIFFSTASYLPQKVIDYNNNKNIGQYEYLKKDGWNNLGLYIQSDMRKNYKIPEFPIVFESATYNNDVYKLNFVCTNKTCNILKVTGVFRVASYSDEFGFKNVELPIVNYVYDKPIAPLTSSPIEVSCKINKSVPLDKIFVNFDLSCGKEYIAYLQFYPMQNPQGNTILRQCSTYKK